MKADFQDYKNLKGHRYYPGKRPNEDKRLNGTRMNTDYTDKYRMGIHKPAPKIKKRDTILSQSEPGF
jgi:hypothetical protein